MNFARGEGGSPLWKLLYPLQFGTKIWMLFRLWCFDRGIFSVTNPCLPTVSVGNNCLGGTNKTPMTEFLVREFVAAGIPAGVVSRGYQTKKHPPLYIGQDPKSFTREFAGDEPLMLASRLPNCPVVVSKNRLDGVELLASLGAKVAVTDDTFQHRAISRDVDVVLVDASCPFGNGSLIPAGSMREPMSAFSRADIVVITKANQSTPEKVQEVRQTLSKYVNPDRIFVSNLVLQNWNIYNPKTGKLEEHPAPSGRLFAISAIGSPKSFSDSLRQEGIDVVATETFQDHHTLTMPEIKKLNKQAEKVQAVGFVCTEKDVTNIPHGHAFNLPLYVPSVCVTMEEKTRFFEIICSKLQPKILLASNGHGEDAIGVVLAQKLTKRFPVATLDVFTFVGSGTPYEARGYHVISPAVEMPSGGVIKYNFRDLLRDLRSGLGRSVLEQLHALRRLSGYITPICVGDVYLFATMLYGTGLSPMLVATAKTVFLSGHFSIEKWLLKKRCLTTFTRDEETAQELRDAGVKATFAGNPIMDLLEEAKPPEFVWSGSGTRVLLLPGSRIRAYNDAKLILDSVVILAEKTNCTFVMVVAPTLDVTKLSTHLEDWTLTGDTLTHRKNSSLSVQISTEPVSAAACGAEVLIGLGGTANQLCAGLGIPVISILEVGKLRQKMLLRDAEILVEATPEALADATYNVITDKELRAKMQEAGIKNLGRTGCLDAVCEYLAKERGLDARCETYVKLKTALVEKKI